MEFSVTPKTMSGEESILTMVSGDSIEITKKINGEMVKVLEYEVSENKTSNITISINIREEDTE